MSTFNEQHYFRSVRGKPANYFRVCVSGTTLLVSSRYLSGYFDENAVDTYFNEIAQPQNASLRPASTDATDQEQVQPVGANPNTKLVMVLSSNSDDIASQIGAFAQSEKVATSLGVLLNPDQARARATAERQATTDAAARQRIVTRSDASVGKLTTTSSQADVEDAFLRYANTLADALGSPKDFASLDAVATWVEKRDARR